LKGLSFCHHVYEWLLKFLVFAPSWGVEVGLWLVGYLSKKKICKIWKASEYLEQVLLGTNLKGYKH
jgi:hypothetical protein